MTTINTADDLVRLLRQNAEFRDTVRRELLTDEILDLPRQFAEMLKTQNSMLQEQAEARQTRNRILAEIAELRQTQNIILGRLDNAEAYNRRLSNDFSIFRGNYAETVATKNATDIAILLNESKSLGIDETRLKVLSGDDLRALAREYGVEKLAAIPLGDRRSFYKADLVMEVAKSDGTTCYITVEASYTCNGRDTARALAHANLLTRFTGKEAWPVIAGVRADMLTQPLIESGEIFWYQLEYDEMGPTEPE